MEKNQTKNILVIVVTLVLIAGGVYYSRSLKDNNLEENKDIEAPVLNGDINPVVEETKDSTALDPSESNNQSIINNSNTTQNKVKFNLAMDNARTAFAKGDYDASIAFYKQALSYENTDTVYSGLFFVYSAQNNIDKARVTIDQAININPLHTEYWIWKLVLLDEKTSVSFADLKRIYEEGLTKVYFATKINLVTSFAQIAEKNGQKTDAIAVWEYAKTIYPENTSIYQSEIDRLKAL